MKVSPLHPHTGSNAAVNDGISTSSSTLVNLDHFVEKSRPARKNTDALNTLQFDYEGKRRAQINLERAAMTPREWLKSSSPETGLAGDEEYPDDHRCSDHEAASGLCPCAQGKSAESTTSSETAGVSEDREGTELLNQQRSRSQYTEQLFAARKRKLLSEEKPAIQWDDRTYSFSSHTPKAVSTARNFLSGSGSSGRTSRTVRDLHSDPILIPRTNSRQASTAHKIEPSSEEEFDPEEKRVSTARRRASSPTYTASPRRPHHSYSIDVEQCYSPRKKESIGATLPATGSERASTPGRHPQVQLSAARKSINSVFEKLLKEEEERQEEERARREAARERRREEKRRRESEWPGHMIRTSETISFPSIAGETTDKHFSAVAISSSSSITEEGSSSLQGDADRLKRIARGGLSLSLDSELKRSSSPEKDTSRSYKARLDDLRLPSPAGREGNMQGGSSPTPLVFVDIAPDSDYDAVSRFSFPGRKSDIQSFSSSPHLPPRVPSSSTNQFQLVPHTSLSPASSSSSPRKGSHRRAGTNGESLNVISLSANSPSSVQVERLEDLLSPSAKPTEHASFSSTSQALRRVTFSEEPEIIEEYVDGETLSNQDEKLQTLEPLGEVTQIDLDVIEQSSAALDSKAARETSLRSSSLPWRRRVAASPAFPGAYVSPSTTQTSPLQLLSRQWQRSRSIAGTGTMPPLERGGSPPLRNHSPLPHVGSMSGPPLSRSSSANLSISDHSISEELQEVEEEGEDQVTAGSDFQGHAPLQSTPPRSTSSDSHRRLASSFAEEQPLVKDESIRQTLQQLSAALQRVNEIKAESSLIRERDTSGPGARLEDEKGLVLQTLVQEEGRLSAELAQVDEAYVKKLTLIRQQLHQLNSQRRLSSASETFAKTGIRPWSVWTTCLCLALCIILLAVASEWRARHLFLTTYYDPVQPYDFLSFPPAFTGSALNPVLQWLIETAGTHFTWDDDESMPPAVVGGQRSSGTLVQMMHGPNRRLLTHLLLRKAVQLIGMNSYDMMQMGTFAPT